MIAVFGILRYAEASLPELLPHLRELQCATRANDGCIAYDVAVDVNEPGLLRFAELWPDQATLDRHFQAPHMEPWLQASRRIGVLERRFSAYEVGASRAL